jgi:PPOX class probable F420-dependent enzyme
MLVGTEFKEKSNTVAFQLPDPSTPFGERVARRLRKDRLIWFTTVDAKGTPQPTPVWFLWDETNSTILIYSRADAKRLGHLKHNSRVALNFDGNGNGGDIIVITGEAHISTDDPPADRLPIYVEKYRELIGRSYKTAEAFAAIYSVTLRIRPIAIRGH